MGAGDNLGRVVLGHVRQHNTHEAEAKFLQTLLRLPVHCVLCGLLEKSTDLAHAAKLIMEEMVGIGCYQLLNSFLRKWGTAFKSVTSHPVASKSIISKSVAFQPVASKSTASKFVASKSLQVRPL